MAKAGYQNEVSEQLKALAYDVMRMLEVGVVEKPSEIGPDVEYFILQSGTRQIRAMRTYNIIKDDFDYRFEILPDVIPDANPIMPTP